MTVFGQVLDAKNSKSCDVDTLLVHHDFNLPLKLYSIPDFFVNQLKKQFTKLKFVDISTEGNIDNVKIYFGNRINNQLLERCSNIQWVHLGCVGYDAINTELLRNKKILMTNSAGLLTNSMVELILNFMTTISRGMHHISALRAKKQLDRKHFDQHFETTTSLAHQKVLICGYGAVGKKLAKILEQLDMDIYTISRSQSSDYKHFMLQDLESLVTQVHYIVNLLPLSSETFQIFNSRLFSKMSNVNFINLGRGKTVKEKDLLLALDNHNLQVAALDVFEHEPFMSDSELLAYQNLLITPHVAGVDSKYWHKQLNLFKSNLQAFLGHRHESLINRIT